VCATVALAVAGCSTGSKALGTHTAQVSINGKDEGLSKVDCEQVQWVWHIESLKDTPGFTAQVRTGDSVKPRAVQIHDVGGFTGSFWDLTVGDAEATVDNGTFTITGTAEGYYHTAPNERSSARFRIETDC
jgi:ipoprotein LpqH